MAKTNKSHFAFDKEDDRQQKIKHMLDCLVHVALLTPKNATARGIHARKLHDMRTEIRSFVK